MQAAPISDIKKQLKKTDATQLIEICLELARFKKDNKELLTYLLFEADDEGTYISAVKTEMDDLFAEINTSNLYFAKKSLRKILRNVTKYIRYTGSKTAEAELLIYYCKKMKMSGISFKKSPTLVNLYTGVLKKIDAVLNSLHEDLRHDYSAAVKDIKNYWF